MLLVCCCHTGCIPFLDLLFLLFLKRYQIFVRIVVSGFNKSIAPWALISATISSCFFIGQLIQFTKKVFEILKVKTSIFVEIMAELSSFTAKSLSCRFQRLMFIRLSFTIYFFFAFLLTFLFSCQSNYINSLYDLLS
jgi:hypothetical protein